VRCGHVPAVQNDTVEKDTRVGTVQKDTSVDAGDSDTVQRQHNILPEGVQPHTS